MAEVELIDIYAGYVLLTDDTLLPITNFMDGSGDDTDDPDEAVACVAGTDEYGWLTIEINRADGSPVRIH